MTFDFDVYKKLAGIATKTLKLCGDNIEKIVAVVGAGGIFGGYKIGKGYFEKKRTKVDYKGWIIWKKR